MKWEWQVCFQRQIKRTGLETVTNIIWSQMPHTGSCDQNFPGSHKIATLDFTQHNFQAVGAAEFCPHISGPEKPFHTRLN